MTELRNHGAFSAETQFLASAVVATNEKAARTKSVNRSCNLQPVTRNLVYRE